jgi:hypothetical protein
VHFLKPNRGLHAASSGLHLRSYRDRRNTLARIFSCQIGAFAPFQAGFTSGHIVIDATPLACIFSGQIGAFAPLQAGFTSGRIVTDATLLARIFSGQIRAFAPLQADFIFGHDDK